MDFHTLTKELHIPLSVVLDRISRKYVAKLIEGAGEDSDGTLFYPYGEAEQYSDAIEDLGRELEGKILVLSPYSKTPTRIPIPKGFESGEEEEGFFLILEEIRHDIVDVNLTNYIPVVTTAEGRQFELYSYKSTWKNATDVFASPALRRLIQRVPLAAWEVPPRVLTVIKEESCSTT